MQDGRSGIATCAPLIIGTCVTVGHQAILHGCTVGQGALIGMGARVLNGAVSRQCLVGQAR